MLDINHAMCKRLERILGLSDWEIVYRVSQESHDCIGDVDTRPRYKEAVVTIYEPMVMDRRAKGFSETVAAVVLHELCEVAVADCLDSLPDSERDKDYMMDFRDAVADKIARMFERMGIIDGE